MSQTLFSRVNLSLCQMSVKKRIVHKGKLFALTDVSDILHKSKPFALPAVSDIVHKGKPFALPLSVILFTI